MYEEIAKHIKIASFSRSKSAMFHYQVLLHADELIDVDPKIRKFCREVGMEESYAVEFSKMLKVSKIMKQQGMEITNTRR